MRVRCLRSWIVEYRAERRRRNLFGARRLNHMYVEIVVDDVRECAVGLVSVRIFSNSQIRGWAVELRKEQTAVPLAIIETAGEQHLHAVVESLSVADPPFV